MRRLIAAAVVAVMALTAASAFGATRSIAVGDNWYVKSKPNNPTVSVRAGDTVVWRWRGNAPHNVVVTKGPARFRSGIQSSGSFKRKVTRRGTYTIICTVHTAADQRMTLRVR